MNPAPDEFEALRKLLALKRYEQPPPGYFRDFRAQILARLRDEATQASVPWWQRLVARLDLQPSLVAAFGMAVIGVCLFGVNLSNQLRDSPRQVDLPLAEQWYPVVPQQVVPFPTALASKSRTNPAQPSALSSMHPVLGAGPPKGIFAPGVGLRWQEMQAAGFRTEP